MTLSDTGEDRDVELLHRIAAGDVQALGELYDRHITAAYSLALRMLADQRAAEDVCQEAFLAAWRGAHSFDAERGVPRAWLLRVVRNRAIDALRRRDGHARRLDTREHVLELVPTEERTDTQAITNVQARDARAAMHALPAEQRQAIALAYYGGLTNVEIAEALGQPLGTVKGRLRLGLQKLRHLTAAAGAPRDRAPVTTVE